VCSCNFITQNAVQILLLVTCWNVCTFIFCAQLRSVNFYKMNTGTLFYANRKFSKRKLNFLFKFISFYIICPFSSQPFWFICLVKATLRQLYLLHSMSRFFDTRKWWRIGGAWAKKRKGNETILYRRRRPFYTYQKRRTIVKWIRLIIYRLLGRSCSEVTRAERGERSVHNPVITSY